MSFKQLLKGTLGDQKGRVAADRPALSAVPRVPAPERPAGQASVSVLYLAGDARETRMLPGGFSYDHPHLALDLSLDINEARPRLAQPGRYDALVIGWSVAESEAASLVRFVRALGSTIAIVAITERSGDGLRDAGADQCVPKGSALIAQLPTAIEDALKQRSGRAAPSTHSSNPSADQPIDHSDPAETKFADAAQSKKPADASSSGKTLRVAYAGEFEPLKLALGGDQSPLQMMSLAQALRDSDVRPQGSAVPFEVIVIDHGASGRQTAATLADVRARSLDVPVVLVLDPREERTVLQTFGTSGSGVDDCIVKTPDWPLRLQAKLETVCARHQQQRELAALRVKESRLRALVDRLPACVVRLSPEGVILATNAVAMSLLGASQPNQLLRKPFEAVVDAAAKDGWGDFVRRVCSGDRRTFEFQLTGLDGVSRTVEADAVPSPAEGGGSASVLMVLRDVSDRKQLEASLEEAIRRTPLASADEAVLEPPPAVMEVIAPPAPATAAPDPRVLRDLETDLHRIADRARSTFDELGTMLRDVATQHDAAFSRQVDAYTRIKAEQLEHWRSYEAFVQASAHGVVRVAMDDSIQMVNPAFAAMLGYESPDAVTASAPSIAQLTDERRWRTAVDEWRGGSTGPVECHWRRRDGAIAAMRLHGRLVANAAGDGEFVEVVVEDVGAQRGLESQLRRARRWEDAARVTTGIAADLSHLISSINDATERLLSEAPADGVAREHADALQQSVSRALALSRQLVAFGRKEARDPRAFDLNAALHALEHVVRRLIDEHIELALELADAVGTVEGSQPALEEALVHLTVAAAGALPAGGQIRISTAACQVEPSEAVDGLEPGRYAVLSIAASGWGLDADIHDRLSDRIAATSSGAPMRLASARRSIAAMGGHVAVAGTPGSSLVFNVYVPRTGADGFESDEFGVEVPLTPSSIDESPETRRVEM